MEKYPLVVVGTEVPKGHATCGPLYQGETPRYARAVSISKSQLQLQLQEFDFEV
jgi:hypothetical protein